MPLTTAGPYLSVITYILCSYHPKKVLSKSSPSKESGVGKRKGMKEKKAGKPDTTQSLSEH